MSDQNTEYEGWYVVTAIHYNHVPANLDALVPFAGYTSTEVLTNLVTYSPYREDEKFRFFKPVTKKGANGPAFDRNDLSYPVASSYIRTDVYKVRDYAAARPDTDFSLVLSTFDRGGIWGGAPGQVYRTDIIDKEQTHYHSWFDICLGKLQHIAFSAREDQFWVGKRAVLRDAEVYELSEPTNNILYTIPDDETNPVKFLTDITIFSALIRYNDPDPNHALGGMFFDDREPKMTIDLFLSYQQNRARGIVESAWEMTH